MLAAAVTGLELIVSGHNHESVPPMNINGTWVVQVDPNGVAHGELSLGYSLRDGAVDPEFFDCSLYPVDGTTAPDATLAAALPFYVSVIDAVMAPTTYGTVLALSFDDLVEGPGESNLGNLVTDATVSVVSGYLALSADPSPVEVAFDIGYTIRDPLLTDPTSLPTQVQVADAFAVTPLGFDPTDASGLGYPMMEFYLTADELRQVLEVGASLSPLRGSDYWVSVGGAYFVYDPIGPFLNRVTGIWLDAGGPPPDVCDAGTNLLLGNPFTLYRVSMNGYLAAFVDDLANLTGGGLSVVAKTNAGAPVDPTTRTVADPSGGTARQWSVLASEIGNIALVNGGLLTGYSTVEGRAQTVAQAGCP